MTELRTLEYQQRALRILDCYLQELTAQARTADKIADANAVEQDPDLLRPERDVPAETWKKLMEDGVTPTSRRRIPYSERRDGAGRSVPNIVYKIPTGGGKTFLAVCSLSKIFNAYLESTRGFILWIVPNEAIYRQTLHYFQDRRHPYRQLLDNLSGNAFRLMEKDTPLHAADIKDSLCLMILMLQSSNRQDKKTLKVFQERGDVYGFSPPADDQKSHIDLHKKIPNLDQCDLVDSDYHWLPIKESLGNALRIIRPVVVLDEGHRAVSDLAYDTLYGFNPAFVLELTATPRDVIKKNALPRYQNILVEISGIDLDREEMIKMPLNLDSRQSLDWKDSLAAALERLNELDRVARAFHSETNRYIRPILLVQVERTGADQRGNNYIHADDVADWLTTVGQLDNEEIAIKTAERNDLKAPENQNLLSTKNRIRVIVTKQALQEGWDCPFAYVLCSLAATSNLSAMTQLIGRILRQPQARRTGISELDQCYVITHHAETNSVVQSIKNGLEQDGMGDLVKEIRTPDNRTDTVRSISRASQFIDTNIVLPQVLSVDDASKVRPFNYEEDILYRLHWDTVDPDCLVKGINPNHRIAERQLRQLRLREEELLHGEREHVIQETFVDYVPQPRRFDCAMIAHALSDIIPNPWMAYDLLCAARDKLKQNGFNAKTLDSLSSVIATYFRQNAAEQRDSMAEKLFRSDVRSGAIQFRLRADGNNWQMPTETQSALPADTRQFPGKDGQPFQRSLFFPVYKDDFNSGERHFAVYLDSATSLSWWHRNIARNQYFLQGWQRNKIYPDFIFALRLDGNTERLVVVETKGEHLSGNADTTYKRKVLELINESFQRDETVHIGDLALNRNDGTEVCCEMLLLEKWQEELLHCMQ